MLFMESHGLLHCCLFFLPFSRKCQFANSEDAKKALDQLNGFELAGRPMKVGHVTERNSESGHAGGQEIQLDTDELDRTGIDLGATGRLQLMAKLAEGKHLYLVKDIHLLYLNYYPSLPTSLCLSVSLTLSPLSLPPSCSSSLSFPLYVCTYMHICVPCCLSVTNRECWNPADTHCILYLGNNICS